MFCILTNAGATPRLFYFPGNACYLKREHPPLKRHKHTYTMTPFKVPQSSGFVPEGFYADVPDGLYAGFQSFDQARKFTEQHTGTATEARHGRTVKIFICRPGIKLQTEDPEPTGTRQIWPEKAIKKDEKYFCI